MVPVLLFILGREMNAGIFFFFFHCFGCFFSAVESKGEFGLAKARGTLLFSCVCMKILLLPLEFSKCALYCFVSLNFLLSFVV